MTDKTLNQQPEAIALFDRAYAGYLADPAHWEFPADIEARLEALADGECVISAWDAYCAQREAAPLELAA